MAQIDAKDVEACVLFSNSTGIILSQVIKFVEDSQKKAVSLSSKAEKIVEKRANTYAERRLKDIEKFKTKNKSEEYDNLNDDFEIPKSISNAYKYTTESDF